jgi:hypothetical protein
MKTFRASKEDTIMESIVTNKLQGKRTLDFAKMEILNKNTRKSPTS